MKSTIHSLCFEGWRATGNNSSLFFFNSPCFINSSPPQALIEVHENSTRLVKHIHESFTLVGLLINTFDCLKFFLVHVGFFLSLLKNYKCHFFFWKPLKRKKKNISPRQNKRDKGNPPFLFTVCFYLLVCSFVSYLRAVLFNTISLFQ